MGLADDKCHQKYLTYESFWKKVCWVVVVAKWALVLVVRVRIPAPSNYLLVEKYDNSCSDTYIDSFCSYIGISTEYFWRKVYGSLNHELFSIERDGFIKPKFKVGFGL